MPRNPHQGHVDEALQRRTELAVKLAHDWMAAMNMSQRGLARRLDVDQSVLSRFLSQQPGYEPARNRPRILKLLEDVEQFCTRVEDVSLWQEDGVFDSSDVLDVWWRAHTHRLRSLRQDPDPSRALLYVGELVGQALFLPMPYKPHACINTELAISVALFHESSLNSCSDELVRRSLESVESLLDAARQTVPELEIESKERDEHMARALCYAAVSCGYAGLRLSDGGLIQQAAQGFMECTKLWSRPVTRVWHNALHFMERLLEREHPDGVRWSLELVNGVDPGLESLRVALEDHDLGRVRQLYLREAPTLLKGR